MAYSVFRMPSVTQSLATVILGLTNGNENKTNRRDIDLQIFNLVFLNLRLRFGVNIRVQI